MKRFRLFLSACLLLAISISTGNAAPGFSTWEDVLVEARGTTVDWFMYGGAPAANSYVTGYLAQRLETEYDVTLRQVPINDIAEVVGKLLVEKQAGKKTDGQADLMWINGENFRTAKKNGLLYGPYADLLPNIRYVDMGAPSVKNDFGEPVRGLESPWGSAQVVMIHDSTRVPEPPKSVDALIRWIKAHPGRFTYPAPPHFTGSVFVRHIFYHAAGGPEKFQGSWTDADFEKAAAKTMKILNEIKPYLWRQGSTYPESPTRLNQLLADGEVDFSISYHPSRASNLIEKGVFPKTVRTFVFDEGTIANTHFVAIPFNAKDKAAALVLANLLLSPAAQIAKADSRVWGDMPAIDPDRLEPGDRARLDSLPAGIATLPDSVLASHRLPEPPSEILVRLEKRWEKDVLRAR